jgi:Protein of unknown function (DUF1353)
MTEVVSVNGISYRRIEHKKYKYELVKAYEHLTPIDIRPPALLDHDFMRLTTDGMLTVKNKYAWDGASGPARDTPDIMRASLVHDTLYQMLREELLPTDQHSANRKKADIVFREICLADGMGRFRARNLYRGLRLFGAFAARPKKERGPIA